MNKILGNFFKFLGRFFEIITDAIIFVADLLVGLINNIKAYFAYLGIFFVFFFINPYLLIFLLANRFMLALILIFFIVPILGRGLINFLKYAQYVVTEFFYDRADYYLLGKEKKYKSMGGYSDKYFNEKRKKEEEEQKRRAYEQQKQWEDIFNQFFNQTQGGYYNYGDYNTGSYNSGGYTNQTYINPAKAFTEKYEDSCKTLGLQTTTDKYEIKLAYRKMAKKYHPDVNKSDDATQKFQKINEAYEFLSDENIERYKRIKNN